MKKTTKNKVIIFSHENDIDGMGSVILGKIVFNKIEYVLASSVSRLESSFRNLLESGKLYSYDFIFVTDLALDNPSLEMVSKDLHLKDKIRIFDHHKASIDHNLDKYDFTTIIESDENGQKRCGTDLLYQYLLESNLIVQKDIINNFVELTRLEDTWDWKEAGDVGLKAHDMAILFNGLGIENYIKCMVEKLNSNNQEITFAAKEQEIIKNKKEEYREKLQELWNEAEFFIDEFNNPFGVLYADYEYRNEIADYIRNLNVDKKIKYIIIIAMNKGLYGQKSYRSIAKNFDVNKIAVNHGGGGHPEAASVNITKGQKNKASALTKRASLKYLVDSSWN